LLGKPCLLQPANQSQQFENRDLAPVKKSESQVGLTKFVNPLSRNDCRFSGSGSMMNRMSFSETIFLFFLALIVFGPKKLPEIARQVGKALNEFRRASNEFKAQIEQEISNLEVENRKTILPPSPPPEGVASRTLNAASDGTTAAEPLATLAASTDEPVAAAATEPPPVATEAVAPVAPSDAIASATSQESHV
jgi:sec-independent protein translocase protein TatB